MGTTTTRTNKKSIEDLLKRKPITVGNTGAGIESTTDTKSETTRTDNSGTSGITVIRGDEEKRVLGMASVEEEVKTTRKKSSTSRKTKSALKDEQVTQSVKQIAILLNTITGIASMRIGEQWSLTPDECTAIADPLCKIMDKHNLLEKMGDYGDYIALGTALTVAFAPRVMYTIEKGKRDKQNVHIQQTTTDTNNRDTETNPSQAINNGDGGGNGNESNDEASIKQLYPAIVQ